MVVRNKKPSAIRHSVFDLGHVCKHFRCLRKVIVFHQFNQSLITKRRQFRVDREFGEHRQMFPCTHFVNVRFTVHMDLLRTMRALQITVVLNQPQNRDVHHTRHVNRFLDDHRDQLLRTGDNNNTGDRQALEHRQRHITRPRRHIDKHIVNFIPGNVSPKLFDNAGDERTSPKHRLRRIIEQEINAHDLNPRFGLRGQHDALLGTGYPFPL